MKTRFVRRTLTCTALLGALAPCVAAAQAQQGTISGRVTDAANSSPVAAALVAIVGTNQGTQANIEGQYTLRGVAPVSVEVRVLRIGFAETRQRVTVVAGQTVTLDFAINAVAMTINPVVTTATGQQRRVES